MTTPSSPNTPDIRKKLLMFGWTMPSPAFLRDNLKQIEAQPFDGVCIKLTQAAGGGEIFDVAQWRAVPQAARDAELATLAEIPRSQTLSDNFVVMYGASTMDWFSDADWETVLEHTHFCARAAKIAGCVGVCWDPEPYHDINPWRFVALPTRERCTWLEHAEIVRKRGAQIMATLQDAFPDLIVFALRAHSDHLPGSPFAQPVVNLPTAEARQQALEASWWSLHVAFLNGMLDALTGATTFVDGNEEAYYYTSAIEYYRQYTALHQEIMLLIPPELHDRYRARYRTGHAVSMSYLSGEWANFIDAFPDYLRKQALELNAAQQAQWLEHNTYHALVSADEYVWVYTEQQNVWTGENVPPGFVEALRSAKAKYAEGRPLDIEIESVLPASQDATKARA
jgi:hypothetical protein